MKNKISAKIITTLFLSIYFLMPVFVFAQATSTPAAEPAPSSAENIDVELKVPLPFVKTTNGKVKDLKDYIEGVYRLLIGAGALFAVVMIIIAGYQWMINGGSSGAVGDAKKRIWNASIGLVLALMSYIILNTISAKLVSLELPKVKPVQPYYAGSELFCSKDEDIKKLSQAAKDPSDFLTEVGAAGTAVGINGGLCGKRYNIAGNKGQCAGDVCLTEGNPDPQKSCVNGKCGAIMMFGEIHWSPDGEHSEGNGYVDYIRVKPVCGTDLMGDAGTLDVVEKASHYEVSNDFETKITPTDDPYNPTFEPKPNYQILADECTASEKILKGYILEIEVNNDCFSGYTTDTTFAMGKDGATPIKQNNVYDPDDIDWNAVPAESMLQLKDFQTGPLRYDFNIDRSIFPIPDHIGKDDPAKCPLQ